MIDCQKCIHFPVCHNFYNDIPTDADKLDFLTSECQHFVDADKMVKLPCKAGTAVYSVTGEDDEAFVDEGYVASFAVEQNMVEVYVRYESGLTYWFSVEDIGKRVFYSYEEAEKALKELRK